MILVAGFTCLLLPFLFQILKLKMIVELHFVNVIFVGLANICGSVLHFYSFVYFDKFLHFVSGILLCELSYMIFCFLRQSIIFKDKVDRILCLLFMNALNLSFAVLWEFFEYACLIFLNNDAIHHYSSGVHDAMGDMIVALVGGFVVSCFIFYYFKTNHKNYFISLNEKFYLTNFED